MAGSHQVFTPSHRGLAMEPNTSKGSFIHLASWAPRGRVDASFRPWVHSAELRSGLRLFPITGQWSGKGPLQLTPPSGLNNLLLVSLGRRRWLCQQLFGQRLASTPDVSKFETCLAFAMRTWRVVKTSDSFRYPLVSPIKRQSWAAPGSPTEPHV